MAYLLSLTGGAPSLGVVLGGGEYWSTGLVHCGNARQPVLLAGVGRCRAPHPHPRASPIEATRNSLDGPSLLSSSQVPLQHLLMALRGEAVTTLGKPQMSAASEDIPGSAVGNRDSLENQLRKKTGAQESNTSYCVPWPHSHSLHLLAAHSEASSLQFSCLRGKGSKVLFLQSNQ